MWSLNLTTSVENNATYITNKFVQLKLKNKLGLNWAKLSLSFGLRRMI